jgi:hypothetical protein
MGSESLRYASIDYRPGSRGLSPTPREARHMPALVSPKDAVGYPGRCRWPAAPPPADVG